MTHDLGILLTDDLALAAHRGEKTQTRRPIIHRGEPLTTLRRVALSSTGWDDGHGYNVRPVIAGAGLVEVGGRVWVRECWQQTLEVDVPADRFRLHAGTCGIPARPDWPPCVVYRADGPMPPVQWHHLGDSQPVPWCPSIHMPKWACRTWGRITEVRPERVQDITEEGVIREGFSRFGRCGGCEVAGHDEYGDAVADCPGHNFGDLPAFRAAWDDCYAPKGLGWDANPWVWAISFDPIPRPTEF